MFYVVYQRHDTEKWRRRYNQFPRVDPGRLKGGVCYLEGYDRHAHNLPFRYEFDARRRDFNTADYESVINDKKDGYNTFRCPRDCIHHHYKTSVSSFDLSADVVNSFLPK